MDSIIGIVHEVAVKTIQLFLVVSLEKFELYDLTGGSSSHRKLVEWKLQQISIENNLASDCKLCDPRGTRKEILS